MKAQYKFTIERVLDRGFPTPNLRLVIHESDDEWYTVFDIIQEKQSTFKRVAKKIALEKADMDHEDFEFLWKKAWRAFEEKNS